MDSPHVAANGQLAPRMPLRNIASICGDVARVNGTEAVSQSSKHGGARQGAGRKQEKQVKQIWLKYIWHARGLCAIETERMLIAPEHMTIVDRLRVYQGHIRMLADGPTVSGWWGGTFLITFYLLCPYSTLNQLSKIFKVFTSQKGMFIIIIIILILPISLLHLKYNRML